MKPNELRIGNWLEYNEDGTHFQVTEINPTGISVENSDESTWIELDQFSGIRLSEKRLEQFGFVKHDIHWRIKEGDAFYLYGSNCFYAPSVMPEIEYVHQLQNLYFAMTREELEIKL